MFVCDSFHHYYQQHVENYWRIQINEFEDLHAFICEPFKSPIHNTLSY